MDFADLPKLIDASIPEFQLSWRDRGRARVELRHHLTDKHRGFTRVKREKLAQELARLERLEDYPLSQDYIHTFHPDPRQEDDLWRRCDRLVWRYNKVHRRDPDRFYLILNLVKYINLTERDEVDRDYDALWDDFRRNWTAT